MHFVAAAVARLAAPVRLQVLATAGIPEELLAMPSARVPAERFAALWLAVAAAIDDEFFGLDSRRMKVGSFALLARAALHSGGLDRALKQVLRGFAVFLDDVGAELRVEGATATVLLDNRVPDAASRQFADEALLVMVHGLMCWLAGQRIALAEACFAHPRPEHAAEYTVMFSARLVFDAPRTAIAFDAAVLDAPVVQTERTLREFLRTAPQSVFLKYRNEDSWTARVRQRLRSALEADDWPDLEALARDFRVAAPTLRRRLENEGSSYQRIKDNLRRDAAVHQLSESPLSIAEIGHRLGFREPSAFHKAFKKWTGAQPGQYRKQHRPLAR